MSKIMKTLTIGGVTYDLVDAGAREDLAKVPEQINEALLNNQADWAQNDDSSANYIKNRTHWIEDSKIILNELTLTNSGENYINNPLEESIIADQSYTVTFNGVEYDCIANEVIIENSQFAIVLGNLSIAGMGDDTGEPFLFAEAPVEMHEEGIYALVISNDSSASITISIRRNELVHKIPDLYLPPKTHWEEKNVTVLPFMTQLGTGIEITEPFENSLIEGNEYTVIFNGVAYKSTARVIADNDMLATCLGNVDLLLGSGNNGQPFVIIEMPKDIAESQGVYGAVMALDDTLEEVSCAIFADTVVHKLDDKFINTPDWNADEGDSGHIKNRTHYVVQKDIIYLPETTIEYTNDTPIFTASLNKKLEIGRTYSVIFNGVTYNCIAQLPNSDSFTLALGNGAMAGLEYTDEPFGLFFIADAIAGQVGGNAILWLESNSSTGTVTIQIAEIAGTVHKLDKKYLPDDLGAVKSVNGRTGEVVLTATDVDAVPTTRTINNKPLSSSIKLTASDVGAVPTTRTINGKALSSNITLSATDVNAVPTTRTINGKALSSNITLTATDVNAMSKVDPVGTGSFSMNRKADTVIGSGSHAEGNNTTASGDYSHAEGQDTTASGTHSHAEGYNTTASGRFSHVEGYNTTASGESSHAEGSWTIASGSDSHAEGIGTIANTKSLNVIGDWNIIETLPNYIISKGLYLSTSFSSSKTWYLITGEPVFNENTGLFAVENLSIIDPSVINENQLITEENSNNISQYYKIVSFVENKNDINYFKAERYYAESSSSRRGKYIHIVGNGNDKNFRSNAHTLDWDGNAWYAGDVYVGGTSQDDENAKKLITEADIDNFMSKTNPVGTGSFSMNRKADTAIGTHSHAEGYDTTASGTSSHTEGSWTIASGAHSHAEGQSTIASGSESHAEGSHVAAHGIASHAEGGSTTSTITLSGEANATTYICSSTKVKVGALIIKDDIFTHVTNVSTNENNEKVITVEKTLSSEALQEAEVMLQLNVAYGSNSHTEGLNTIASGYCSHAEGNNTTASEHYSHAEGSYTTASGKGSHAEGNQTTANESYSHAEGSWTIASGNCSHAEGISTIASEQYSHAEGSNTTASGSCSHAEGSNTTASGSCSHAECQSTTASGDWSHAEGYITTASGKHSHAEGFNTIANGESSHAEGRSTTASGEYSHAEGISTIAYGDYSHAEGSETVAKGYGSHAEGSSAVQNPTISGEANATTYICSSTVKVGDLIIKDDIFTYVTNVSTNENNEKVITVEKTLSSEALQDTTVILQTGVAYGAYSHTEGHETTAIGDYSHAEGNNTIASGKSSHAEGSNTTASGEYSHAEGISTIASGYYSHAEGFQTIASGDYSHTEGQIGLAYGIMSHVEGWGSHDTILLTGDASSKVYSFLFNSSGPGIIKVGMAVKYNDIIAKIIEKTDTTITLTNTLSDIDISEAQCKLYNHVAWGVGAHAEGGGNIVDGLYAHAEGNTTTANGSNSHAEGNTTTANGSNSHAEGCYTIASGESSHAEGRNTIATSKYQHVQGKYNIEDAEEKYAHIVGNGTSNTNHSNAHTLDWSGNAWYQGTVETTAIILAAADGKRYKLEVIDGKLSMSEVTE